jgi:hypothetical protein
MQRHYRKEAAQAREKAHEKKYHGEQDTSHHVEFGGNGKVVFINPEYGFEEISTPTVAGTDSTLSSSWLGGFFG